MKYPSTKESLERLIFGFRLLYAGIFVTGCFIAVQYGDGHWIDRSGKVIVALSLTLTFVQFRYEVAFKNNFRQKMQTARGLGAAKALPEEDMRAAMARGEIEAKERFERMRSTILLNTLSAAAIGELIAAFGSVGFSILQ